SNSNVFSAFIIFIYSYIVVEVLLEDFIIIYNIDYMPERYNIIIIRPYEPLVTKYSLPGSF
ncbi:uncharacterized protein CLUP02_08020, partial [Colletotrichum lupini]